jgi:hypothetical protein
LRARVPPFAADRWPLPVRVGQELRSILEFTGHDPLQGNGPNHSR